MKNRIAKRTTMFFIIITLMGTFFCRSPVNVAAAVNVPSTPRIENITLSKSGSCPLELQVDIETSGTESLLYQIWVEESEGWTLAKKYDDVMQGTTFKWNPKNTTADNHYKVHVRIKGADTGVVYDQKTQEATCMDLGILKIDKITTDAAVEGQACTGDKINITAYAGGVENIEYQFVLISGQGWTTLQDYSPVNTYEWTTKEGGNYDILVRVRSGNQSDERSMHFEIAERNYAFAELKEVTLTSLQDGIVQITATKGTYNNENMQYRFTAGEPMRSLDLLQDYSHNNLYAWNPEKSGNYMVFTYSKDVNSRQYEDGIRKYYRVTKPNVGNIKINDIELSENSFEQPLCEAMRKTFIFKVNAESTSAEDKLLYSFWRLEARGYRLIQDYSTDNTFEWTPVSPGTYTILARVKDEDSGSYEVEKGITYKITHPDTSNIAINSINVSGSFKKRSNHELTVDAVGSENLMYKFIVVDDLFGWRTLQEFSPNNTCIWFPKKTGTYTVIVWVKDAISGSYEKQMMKEVIIKN